MQNAKKSIKSIVERYQKVFKHADRETQTQKLNETKLLDDFTKNKFKVPVYERKTKVHDDAVLNEEDDEDGQEENDDPDYQPPPPKKPRTNFEEAFRQAQTSKVVTAMMDRTQTTNNQMVLLMGAMATSAKLNVKKAVVGSTTLYNKSNPLSFFFFPVLPSLHLILQIYRNKNI